MKGLEKVKKKIFTITLLGFFSILNADIISQNGIAKDSETGLEWQDEPYTNAEIKAHFENQNSGKMGNREYANKYCENLTLGGYDDWRLPNIYELVTLIDDIKSKNPYRVDGFKNFPLDYGYWSSTTQDKTDFTWYVEFYLGAYDWNDRANKNFIRCVRAKELNFDNLVMLRNKGKIKIGQNNMANISIIKPKIKVQAPLIVKDSITGLQWQDDSDVINVTQNWEGAKKYCENLTLDGYSDWRLPNIYEIATLIDNTKTKAPYIIDGFTNVDSIFSWSSTPNARKVEEKGGGWAWGVSYLNGDITWDNTDDKDDWARGSYTRCVRDKELNFKDFMALRNRGKLKMNNEINMRNIEEIQKKENKKVSK